MATPVAPAGPLDQVLAALGPEITALTGLNMTNGENGVAPLDAGTANVVLFLGLFTFILLPGLKFLVTILGSLFIYNAADKRFFAGSGKKPRQVLQKIAERLSGATVDAIEDRRLKVTRLNDEIRGLQASMLRQETRGPAGRLLRESFARERILAQTWDGVLHDLELSPQERVDVATALDAFAKKEFQRREDEQESRIAWVKNTLRKLQFGQLGSLLEAVRLNNEIGKQLELEAGLIKKLADAMPQPKLERLCEALARSADPLNICDSSWRSVEHIYVIDFDGDIGASRVAQLQKEVTAVINAAAAEQGPVEVVLRVKSPGGTVTGYGLAAAELMRLRSCGVRLVACIDELAASGGYLMACCAEKILCGPFAAVGSIGVISGVPNVADRLSTEGIRVIETTAGKWKRTVTPFKQPTTEDLQKAKEDIFLVYEQFASFVKANRPQVDIEAVATGEVWFGANAVARGLVDELGTSAEYLRAAIEERGAEVLAISYNDAPKTGLSALTGLFGESDGSTAGFEAQSWPLGIAEPRMEADV